jgi:hypothetical protein
MRTFRKCSAFRNCHLRTKFLMIGGLTTSARQQINTFSRYEYEILHISSNSNLYIKTFTQTTFRIVLRQSCAFLVETCGFAVCGLIITICGFAICGLAHLINLCICESGMSPRISRFADFFKKFACSLLVQCMLKLHKLPTTRTHTYHFHGTGT